MKKSEFISEVAQKSGLSKKDTEAVIEAALGTITEALKARDSISFWDSDLSAPSKKTHGKLRFPAPAEKSKYQQNTVCASNRANS